MSEKITYAGHVLFAQQHLLTCEECSEASAARDELLSARQHIDWALEMIAVIETRQHEQDLIDDARADGD